MHSTREISSRGFGYHQRYAGFVSPVQISERACTPNSGWIIPFVHFKNMHTHLLSLIILRDFTNKNYIRGFSCAEQSAHHLHRSAHMHRSLPIPEQMIRAVSTLPIPNVNGGVKIPNSGVIYSPVHLKFSQNDPISLCESLIN